MQTQTETYTAYHGWHHPSNDDPNDTQWNKKVMPIIVQLLSTSRLKKEYIVKLLQTAEVIQEFKKVFTNSIYAREFTDSPQSNYEYYEYIGDGIVNTSVLTYIAEKFPEYQTLSTKPQEVYTRLKITLISTRALQAMLEQINPHFWDLIRCDQEKIVNPGMGELQKIELGTRMKERNKVMEDVFEALIGVTYAMTNKYLGNKVSATNAGPGFPICYNIITKLMEEVPVIKTCISNQILFHENKINEIIPFFEVNDPITILKQMMESKDNTSKNIGILRPSGFNNRIRERKICRILKQENYVTDRIENEQGYSTTFVELWWYPGLIQHDNGMEEFIPKDGHKIGQGSGHIQNAAYVNAAKDAIKNLQRFRFGIPKQESYNLRRKHYFNSPPPSPPITD